MSRVTCHHCQWENFPTPRSHSLSAFRSSVSAHCICKNVTSPGVSLFSFFGAPDEQADTHIIGTQFVSSKRSFAEPLLTASRRALIYCLSNLRRRSRTSPVDSPKCCFSATVCGVCRQQGECKLDLKSDLKVSPCAERPLPLPLTPRSERRWIRHRTGFGVCLEQEWNEPLPKKKTKHLWLRIILFQSKIDKNECHIFENKLHPYNLIIRSAEWPSQFIPPRRAHETLFLFVQRMNFHLFHQ